MVYRIKVGSGGRFRVWRRSTVDQATMLVNIYE